MAVIKAKTSPTGYVALLGSPMRLAEFPVARFDEEGYAMIADQDTGCLVRAADAPGFEAVVPMWQVPK